MSLITCHECKAQVSTEASRCPSCGAKVKKPASLTLKLIFALAGTGIIAASITSAPSQKTEKPAEKSAAQIEQDHNETLRYSMARLVSNQLKESMRDPASFVIETLRTNNNATLICAEYRSRNGFGGMNREMIVVMKDKTSKKISDWNKNCTQSLTDMMWAIK